MLDVGLHAGLIEAFRLLTWASAIVGVIVGARIGLATGAMTDVRSGARP